MLNVDFYTILHYILLWIRLRNVVGNYNLLPHKKFSWLSRIVLKSTRLHMPKMVENVSSIVFICLPQKFWATPLSDRLVVSMMKEELSDSTSLPWEPRLGFLNIFPELLSFIHMWDALWFSTQYEWMIHFQSCSSILLDQNKSLTWGICPHK